MGFQMSAFVLSGFGMLILITDCHDETDLETEIDICGIEVPVVIDELVYI